MREEPRLTRWPSTRSRPKPEELEAILRQEGYLPFRMVDPPCTYYHTRSRSGIEIRWVLEGQLLIGLEDQEIVLSSGDRIDLPAGTKHYMRVLSEDGAVYLLASTSASSPSIRYSPSRGS